MEVADVETRRALQARYGLRPVGEKRRSGSRMDERTQQQERAAASTRKYLEQTRSSGFTEDMKRAAAYCSVVAPVFAAVGAGLLWLGKKMLNPAK